MNKFQTISEFGIIKKTSDYDLTDETFSEIFFLTELFNITKTVKFLEQITYYHIF
nr:hypothetical protein [uncultured Emticicia sp.]